MRVVPLALVPSLRTATAAPTALIGTARATVLRTMMATATKRTAPSRGGGLWAATPPLALDAEALDAASTAALREAPVPVPDTPGLYELPAALHVEYRPLPAPVKASVWLLAALLAALTTRGFLRAVAAPLYRTLATLLRLASSSPPAWPLPPDWVRKLSWFLLKMLALGLVATLAVQEFAWGPSRVTVRELTERYWLPSRASQYRVLEVPMPEGAANATVAIGVHYLKVEPDPRPTDGDIGGTRRTFAAIYAAHGFGASALSWLPALAPLAAALGAPVALAHDATGFGFTDRPADGDLAMFTGAGSAAIGLAVLAQEGVATPVSVTATDANPAAPLLLLGHSMGCRATLRMALDLGGAVPLRVVLVSPALQPPPRRFSATTARLLSQIPLLRPLLDILGAYILRRAIGAPGAWRRGLCLTWGNAARLRASDVLRYQWPSVGRGWERGLLAFARAQRLRPDVTDTELLDRVLQLPNTTVDVVVASRDRITPAAGVRAFFQAHPSVRIVELSGLGHDPFEEDPTTFVKTVKEMLEPTGANPGEP